MATTDPIVVHINCARSSEPHHEELPPHRLVPDCIEFHGFPQCMGSAVYGPERCTCTDTLSTDDHERCIAEAWDAYLERDGEMCHDCAFRAGSPEQDQLEKIAACDEPFRCHQGMPIDARGGVPRKNAYAPVLVQVGKGLVAPEYPICAGWRRAHAALAKRSPC